MAEEEKIDAVISYVKAYDIRFIRERDSYKYKSGREIDVSEHRHGSHDTLRYVLRSINRYARWVNKIYVLTHYDWMRPKYISKNDERIKIVTHKEVFPDVELLPTFNSNAVGAVTHLIPNLSEKFLLFNDDTFLGNVLKPEDFFNRDKPKFGFTERLLPKRKRIDANQIYAATVDNVREKLNEVLGERDWRFPIHQVKPFTKKIYGEGYPYFKKNLEFRFRSAFDIPSSLFLTNFAIAKGRAVEGRYTEHYLAINKEYNVNEMWYEMVRRNKPQFFCLNDVTGVSFLIEQQKEIFLARYFPKKFRGEII